MSAAPEASGVADLAEQPTLLVVDDDATLRSAIVSYLRSHGFVVREAASADSALALASSKKPTLVVLDVMMPGTDGIEMLTRMRADDQLGLATTPVVLLTARGFTSDRIRGYRAGCSAYVTKPFDPDELVAIIRSLLEADGRYAARYIGEEGDAPGLAREESSATPMALPVDERGTQVQASGSTYRIAELDGAPLTEREREVLDKLSRGLMNKEIARDMGISPRMVEKYVSRLLAKTATSTRTELARFAVKRGLVD